METRTILILRGIQGSGKSTYARQWVNEDPEHRVRFNRDDIRNMCGPYWIPEREHFITHVQQDFIYNAMDCKKDVVVDNMNLSISAIDKIVQVVRAFNARTEMYEREYSYEIEYKDFFDVPLETCIERDSKRENPIGEKVIRQTYNKYKDVIQANS